jgi:hypothetical protein
LALLLLVPLAVTFTPLLITILFTLTLLLLIAVSLALPGLGLLVLYRRLDAQSSREHITSCPGAGVDRHLVVFRIVDANVRPAVGVHSRAACSETNAFVCFQIIVQLCS